MTKHLLPEPVKRQCKSSLLYCNSYISVLL